MLRYRVKLRRDTNGTILVDFPEVPEAHPFGADREQALARAADALETAFMGYLEFRRALPEPKAVTRGLFGTLPALTEAKLGLYSATRAAGVGKTELARRLHCHLPQIDRLLDLRHASPLDQLEAAFRALGKHLSVHVSDAA